MKNLTRLINGRTYIPYKNQMFCIRPASVDLRQRADCHYDSIINYNKFSGILSEEKLLGVCVKKGILEPDYKKYIDDTMGSIRRLKIALFKALMQPVTQKEVRRDLSKMKESSSRLFSHLYSIKRNSLEGLASYCRDNFVFINSIYLNGKRVNIKDSLLLNHLMYKYGQQKMTEAEIKKASRSNEWRGMWSAKKHGAFDNKISTLTDEQLILLQTSQIYDYAYKHEKCPNDTVFEDDDMFDGWYFHQVDQAKKKSKKEDSSGNQYEEKFIIANTQEEADAVVDMNDQESMRILRQRTKQITEKKDMRDSDFADVRSDFSKIAHQGFIQKVKGK